MDISALAAQLAGTVSQGNGTKNASAMGQAQEFHRLLSQQMSNVAKSSPDQILQMMKASQNMRATSQAPTDVFTPSNAHIANMATVVLDKTRSKAQGFEQANIDVLTGEGSMVDLLSATTEFQNTLSTMVKVRDKFLEAHDKLFGMNI